MDRKHTVTKSLSTHVFIILTQVSASVEDASQQSATITHALKESNTYMPTHAPSGPALL
jgi:hypothetical protein